MNGNARKILISAITVAAGILAVIFPYFNAPIAIAVGLMSIVYAMVMGTVYRASDRSGRAAALAVAAAVSAVAGVLLFINRFIKFMPQGILLFAALVSGGLVTVGLALRLRDRRFKIWLSVFIAGVGSAVAGIAALFMAEAALLAGCVTAAVIILRPVIAAKLAAGRDERGNKIVTVKDKDIEIIEDENSQTQDKK